MLLYVWQLSTFQCVGIPLGNDPTPFWVILCLYGYAADFIFNLIKIDKSRIIKFKNSSRFIDDGCNLNDFGEFSKVFYVTYPNELQLKSQHHGLHVTFHDLDVTVVGSIYEYKFHGKRDNYPFYNFGMPDLSYSIALYIFTGQFYLNFLKWLNAH